MSTWSQPRDPDGRRAGDGPPRVLAPSTEGLLDQVAWFNGMRLVAALAMLVITAAADALGAVADAAPLYALAGLTLLVDLVYAARFRRLARVSPGGIRRHVDLQIAVDLVILTAILHYSGGVTNPCVLFYLFHTFIAALLLSARAALLVAAVSVALVSGLAFCERQGILPHRPLPGLVLIDLQRAAPEALIAWVAVFAATQLLTVYFVGRVLSRLGRREEQLARVDRQLAHSERLASVGTLAAGVAHEINNPVGVIQSKVQILRYRIADGEPPQALEAELTTIEKHARRIGTITAGLLAFSREAPFSLAPIDLNQLVREGVELAAVPLRRAGVSLDLDLVEPPPRITGSANHLLQVLVNLLLNAADASPRGGRVTVRTSSEAGRAALRVEDRGEGIPEVNLSKIFDPFFTTKDVDRGTGLGLAISHGIVDAHHGKIEVDSAVGEGTVFTVWLPLDAAAPPARPGRGRRDEGPSLDHAGA